MGHFLQAAEIFHDAFSRKRGPIFFRKYFNLAKKSQFAGTIIWLAVIVYITIGVARVTYYREPAIFSFSM